MINIVTDLQMNWQELSYSKCLYQSKAAVDVVSGSLGPLHYTAVKSGIPVDTMVDPGYSASVTQLVVQEGWIRS